MAQRRSFWQRARDAFRTFFNEPPDTPPRPEPVPFNSGNEAEFSVPQSGPIDGLTYNDDDTTEQREDRETLVRQVMEWFKSDGAYWDRGRGRYVNEYGDMRSPARLSTVVRNISEFTSIEVNFGLQFTRYEWQSLASRNASYWYH